VRRGQLLAEIDPRPFRIKLEQARATTARDVASLKNAQLDLTRYESLLSQRLIAQQQLDAQRSQVDQLTATIQADQANADDAALQLAYTRILSPIDGVAGIRLVDPGNLVHASDTNGIVVLTQLEPIAVVFTLPQDDLPRLSAAMAENTRKVSAVSRAGDQVLGEGKLTVIDNQINTATASVRLKAVFDNPKRKLWPNLFVRARIEVSHRDAALVLPAAAVQQGPNGAYVYVLAQGDVAQMRDVKVALLQGEDALIESGVQKGDRVVIEGQEQIKPNSPVNPLEPGATGGPKGRGGAARQGAGKDKDKAGAGKPQGAQ
jgi:multidrug efflux system membrane fusion protein